MESADGSGTERELPFVIGVLGDFAGMRYTASRLRDRQFLTIDRDNFTAVLASLQPRVCFSILDRATGDKVAVDLTFCSLADFEPASLVQRIEPRRALRESALPDARDTVRRYLDGILHAPAFQAIESVWRGLWFLVSRTQTSETLKIKVLDASKKDLLRDLQRAPEFDQSELFKKVNEKASGHLHEGPFHDEPFALLIGDYAFSRRGEDIELLEKLSLVAGWGFAPFIAAAGPEMFVAGLAGYLLDPPGYPASSGLDLRRTFDTTEYARWKAFRRTEDARYISLTLPRMLLRSPYRIPLEDTPHLRYEEGINGDSDLLWGNSAYAFGVCAAKAFARDGWCAAIRGIEGGRVEGIPAWDTELSGERKLPRRMERLIACPHELELDRLGFMPLVQCWGTDYAAFISAPSCVEPGSYNTEAATVRAHRASRLQYVLTTGRFMHYLREIAHNRSGAAGFSAR